jgi:hypothetical protein
MSKSELPTLTAIRSRFLMAAYSLWESGVNQFKAPNLTETVYGDNTAKNRASMSNMAAPMINLGLMIRNDDRMLEITEYGKWVAENIDHVNISGAELKPTKSKKIPLKDIQPIAKPFTPNLSNSAETLQNTIGQVLDDNQAYRDEMKSMLESLARFLGATITYRGEEEDGSSEEA